MKRKAAERLHSLLTDLKSCRDFHWARQLHANAVEVVQDTNPYVLTALIRMYAKCGSMVDARVIFDTMLRPDVVSWTALLLGYATNREERVCLELFFRMKSGYVPNSVTYIAVLKACTSLAVKGNKRDILEYGRKLHSEAGSFLNPHAQNTLIDLYAKCGSMDEARRVFDSMAKPEVVSWNTLLLGYVECGKGDVALDLFFKITENGCVPDSVTYLAALKACSSLALNGDEKTKQEILQRGRLLHKEIGCNFSVYVQGTLIDMYSKCGSIFDARCVFDSIQKPDMVSWNALLLGYADAGEGYVALDLFSRMKAGGYIPDTITFVAALKACTSLATSGDERQKIYGLERGREIHIEAGSNLCRFVQNTLVDMYSKCGSMVEARHVFESIRNPDVISWSALLLGYAEAGEGHTSLDIFSRMKSRGCTPNSVTYIAALKACTTLATNGDLEDCHERGRHIHAEIGCHLNHYVKNTLIRMYAKCGHMVEAHNVFDTIGNPDVVSWTALILGYAEAGDGHISLDLLRKMKEQGCLPNTGTHVAVLKACGIIGSLVFGRKCHSDITEFPNLVVTSLVDFYAKCGSMKEAQGVFDHHPRSRDVTTWTALLAGYGSLGDSHSVFELFEAMQSDGIRPDAVTFVCLLLCCSHAGLVAKAKEYFEAMPLRYRVAPTLKHYTCIVDALGRANQLNEAIGMIRKMPCNPDAVTWMTLLGACHKWKNVEIGMRAFEALVVIDKKNSSPYVLMGHIYGSSGMLEEQEKLLKTRTKLGAWEVSGQAFAYVSDETGQSVRFVVELHQFPTSGNLGDAEDCGHAERRAVLYGLLKTDPAEPVRVFKNKKICEDCHCTTKIVSKVSARTVMIRDTSMFHVMVNGHCSCRDYW